MDTQVEEERVLDSNRCGYVFPEGHGRHGERCTVKGTSTGYCPSHTKLLGLGQSQSASASSANGSESGENEGLSAAEMAEASLARSAAVWLASAKTQKALLKRWDAILAKGTDAELIRLVKELMDRVYGRATEAQPEPEVRIPRTLAEVAAMTPAERRAALLALED